MTDPELLAKKLAFVESCVRELRELARADRIETDLRERRFVEHSLQLAIQAVLDAAAHVVAARRLGEPETLRQLFDRLRDDGWIDADLAHRLGLMAGFRNILVHGYTAVDLDVVRDVLANHLDDLLAFVAAVRAGLDAR